MMILKLKNRRVWLLFDFFKITAAIYEKNPILSKRTEILVQDKKITRIFNGFIFASLKKIFVIGSGPANSNIKQINAPTRQKIQYKAKDTFPILIFQSKTMERIISNSDTPTIINGAICIQKDISTPLYNFHH